MKRQQRSRNGNALIGVLKVTFLPEPRLATGRDALGGYDLILMSFPCSPYQTTRGLVYFARMLDKIRLHAAGQLAPAYHEFLADGFDGRCLRFLGVTYAAVQEQVAAGGTDEQILDWCLAHGRSPHDEDGEVWNNFMCKRGWRDNATDRVAFRLKEAGLESLAPKIATMFDLIDYDEGRTPPDRSTAALPQLTK